MKIIESISGWIDKQFAALGLGAFRSVRLGILVLVPMLLPVAAVDLLSIDRQGKAALAAFLFGGLASILLAIWIGYRASVWAQNRAIERAANATSDRPGLKTRMDDDG